MKDEAPYLDLPNDQNPKPMSHAFYGNRNVPRRTNEGAKYVDPSAVMRAVNEGK